MKKTYVAIILMLVMITNALLSGCIDQETLHQILSDQHLSGNREDYEDILNEIFCDPLPDITTCFGLSFPPVSDSEQLQFTEDALYRLNCDHVRFSVHWKYIEPVNDVWRWDSFDKPMTFMRDHNISILLTIEANGPDWACSDDPKENNERSCVFQNISYFEDFVFQLATRYAGYIDKIQFGNEVLDDSFFIGSVEDYALASTVTYEVFKQVSPCTSVVLSGFSTGVLRRYVAGEHNVSIPVYFQGKILSGDELEAFLELDWVKKENDEVDFLLQHCMYDIIDIHLYDDVENWDEIYTVMLQQANGKEIIVSEFGGPLVYCIGLGDDPFITLLGPTETEEIYTDAYHAKTLYRYMLKLNEIGIDEAYYFKLVENNDGNGAAKSGLIDFPQLKEKPGFYVFQEINSLQFF